MNFAHGELKMKRSDMLEIIDKAYEKFENDWTNLDIDDDDAISNFKPFKDRILDAIEDAGMLPPEVSPLPQQIIDDCLSGNYWENENE